ncbi:MAG: hypothetical protein EB141_17820 [Verrucomicrobia bacterium]|nr:hypothetical protein [Verrucomicrobiota bacterium]NBU07426.1 hypothetical protein [Pseudomonadota bacterium]NDA68973.1 hypothetical protein [Verrucomicrobiota bacterium]NDB77470.1 hypothetical protein [Verrucomicrobiota bacterium]NDD40662.1 hypothetical protein [Verrucomicrobiota bacterium]
MNVTRILPDLQCALVCEDVRQEVSGNFILLGVAAFLRVPQVPIVASRLCVFSRWCAGVGNFVESVRLIAPDQTTVLREVKVKFGLQDPAHSATNLSVFAQLEITAGGIYFIEVLVDDVMKLRFPLPVVVTPPPSQGAPAAPPAA